MTGMRKNNHGVEGLEGTAANTSTDWWEMSCKRAEGKAFGNMEKKHTLAVWDRGT